MHIYLKNNRAKFRPFWFERTGPWAFFEDRRPTRTTTRRIRWVAIWDQFLIQKQYSKTEQNNKSCNWQYPLKLPPKNWKNVIKLKQNWNKTAETTLKYMYFRNTAGLFQAVEEYDKTASARFSLSETRMRRVVGCSRLVRYNISVMLYCCALSFSVSFRSCIFSAPSSPSVTNCWGLSQDRYTRRSIVAWFTGSEANLGLCRGSMVGRTRVTACQVSWRRLYLRVNADCLIGVIGDDHAHHQVVVTSLLSHVTIHNS